MTRVSLDESVDVKAPASVLWAHVTDWDNHGEWIPLTRVEMVSGPAKGVGGQIRAWSGVGPIGFWDPITVTEWEENPDGSGRCAFVHTGRIVKGDAEITVSSLGEGRSRLRWAERFDLGRAGTVAWKVGGGLVRSLLNRSLRELAARVESGL